MENGDEVADEQEQQEQRFVAMGARIESMGKKLKSLKEFIDLASANREHFEEREIEVATEMHRKLASEKAELSKTLGEQLRLYEEKVIKLAESIKVRSSIIQKCETAGLFDENDPLFDVLVETHAGLEQELADARRQLD